MKTVVVTGANGFVGSWLIKELVKHSVKVYAIIKDKLENVSNIDLLSGVVIVYCALEDLDTLSNLIYDHIDVFYHLAWAGSAGKARSDENLQIRNAQWSVKALEAAHRLNCPRVVVAGSIMEKETISAIYRQDYTFESSYIYGLGKVLAHGLCKSYSKQLGLNLIWGVITNAYGEGEISPRFINTTIRKMLRNEELEFTSGTQLYDFVHVEDVARAFFLLGERGRNDREYLIGSSSPRELKEYIKEIHRILKPDNPLLFGAMPYTGITLTLEDYTTSLIEEDTGFHSMISFEEGIKRTSRWIKGTL